LLKRHIAAPRGSAVSSRRIGFSSLRLVYRTPTMRCLELDPAFHFYRATVRRMIARRNDFAGLDNLSSSANRATPEFDQLFSHNASRYLPFCRKSEASAARCHFAGLD
jgi:hypothetical protein